LQLTQLLVFDDYISSELNQGANLSLIANIMKFGFIEALGG